MDQLDTLFKHKKLRLTRPRQALFRILSEAHEPLDLTAINTRIAGSDRTSTYRNLELFAATGIIEVIHVGWKKRYELAAPFAPHHHHLVCIVCGNLTALDTPEIETVVETLARKHTYEITDHHFELRGVCSTCRTHSS
jgi:Fe2+ or Zn2+ uptake regulation protein